jgi:hypothetical protein
VVWGAFRSGIFQHASVPSTLTPFTLYGGFESNPFSTYLVMVGGDPFQAKWNIMQGYLLLEEMSLGGNPFPSQWIPLQGCLHSQRGFVGGKYSFLFKNQISGSVLPFNQNQGFIQGSDSSANSSWCQFQPRFFFLGF